MSLKDKAISSFNWTILDGLISQGFLFLIGILLARMLSPAEIGIIGILTVFLAISNIIVEAGFGSALIRKTNVTDLDYNTVFYINLITSVVLYIILLLASGVIADFFNIPELNDILKVAGIVLVLNALSLIHKTQYTKFLKFKLQAIVSVSAAIVSGFCAILMAYYGFGIWSLVALVVIRPIVVCIAYWFTNTWRPKWVFSKDSFNELFEFGYKLLVANMINTVYHNAFYIIIGKVFSAIDLGYYTRAEQFKTPITSNITTAIQRISFPILSSIKEDKPKLKRAFTRFIRFAVFLNFPIMLGVVAFAEPMIIVLIGEKWRPSIFYLQLLCIPGMLYPLQILHLNLLLVLGHSNLNLKLEVIKKVILIPILIITAYLGLTYMIYGLVLFSVLEFFINSFYTKRLIGYSWTEQFKDIAKLLLISIITSGCMFFVLFFPIDYLLKFILQILIGTIIFLFFAYLFNIPELKEVYNKVKVLIKTKIR
ncbi:MAG: O-antigen/teichoic acid export membrane protein [Maribacter sp.]|jgi:O-antigen/teichoic acid export membrane protein